MANMKIDAVEGIGPAYATKLQDAGIKDTDAYLEQACSAAGRKALEESTGISGKLLLGWANMVDLCRINGVGPEFAELLEASGVDTVKELRNRNAANLATKMGEVNAEKKLTRVVPTEKQVTDWVEQAKELPPKIEH